MNSNLVERALKVQAIVDAHFEEGRQDRSKKWCFERHVRKEYPMSERTFWRMLRIAKKHKLKEK